MRVKIWQISTIAIVLFMLVACESINNEPSINPEEYYGDGSFFISLARIESTEIRGDYCSTPRVYELRPKRNLLEYGTVAVFRDGVNLNFQIDLNQERINEGWGIERSLIWIGLAENWVEGKDGPEGGYGKVEGIDIKSFQSFPNNGLHQFQLEDWMFEECFTIAVRVTVYDAEMNGEAADGFINHGDYLTFMFNEPFCLEKCIDPGVRNVSYWESNEESWPHGIIVGNTFYSEGLGVQTLNNIESSMDMTEILFEQLVCAKLNVAVGNTYYCILREIEDADYWMKNYGPVGNGVYNTSAVWESGLILSEKLLNYNKGLLCADPAN